ncbi:hypothetical protein DB42_BP00230 [Neochlamydia sp. EPS4]|uniref:DUF721 domain-containing protein n=1 Tax=Neochlamydia sp. EPS4 TaxID=1478175 RepID=UPI000583D6DD|nr:DUF721 domain-containing protein [Neochlamydia sp. EPS4]KIC73842.1 hypothetical protein DB42_BP00230 [Neochlamydia sp. EPS4]
MQKAIRRTPKNYDGTAITTHKISDVLSQLVFQIRENYRHRPDLVLAAWPEVIGAKLASMTQAMSFIDGILHVKVKNSTLHSLLSQNDKNRIIASLKTKFPHIHLKNIVFRIG